MNHTEKREPFAISKAEAFNASKWNKYGISLIIAIVVISLFILFCLIIPFYWKIDKHFYILSVILVFIQMYLYTGIFITAHDAMHGLILPSYPLFNKYIGMICVQMYAFFDYDLLLKAHINHHNHSGKLHDDPDYHEYKYDQEWKIIIIWFIQFMKEYISIKPILLRGIVYTIFNIYFKISHFQLNIFWSLPSILSSFQLWYFGTYLVHRQTFGNYNGNNIGNKHNAYTDYSKTMWYHLFTCYAFGIHYEHHKYPYLPWWYLPFVYKQNNL